MTGHRNPGLDDTISFVPLPALADQDVARAVRCLFNGGFDTSAIAQLLGLPEHDTWRFLAQTAGRPAESCLFGSRRQRDFLGSRRRAGLLGSRRQADEVSA